MRKLIALILTLVMCLAAANVVAEGKLHNGNCNEVLCITTGEIFSSCTDAAEKFGVTVGTMSVACRTKGRTCNGHRFCYLKDINSYIDSISHAINKANAYDILMEKENTRREMIATIDQRRDAVTAIEFKLCELQKELDAAKLSLAAAECDLKNFV